LFGRLARFGAAGEPLPAVVDLIGAPEDRILDAAVGATPKWQHEDLQRCTRHRRLWLSRAEARRQEE